MIKSSAIRFSLFSWLLLVLVGMVQGQPVWHLSGPTAMDLRRLVKFQGDFYAVDGTTLLRSPDLIQWTQVNTPLTSVLTGLVGNDSTLMVYGKGGMCVTHDGLGWQKGGYSSDIFVDATVAGSRLVAIQSYGTIESYRSDSGWTWTPSPVVQPIGLAWGNGLSLALNTMVYSSLDGSGTWNPVPGSDTLHFGAGPVFHAGLFAAITTNSRILTSPDGIQWTARTPERASYLKRIVAQKDGFLAMGAAGMLLHSADGLQWDSLPSACDCVLEDAILDDSGYFAFSDDALAAPLFHPKRPGAWTSLGGAFRPHFTRVRFGNGRFLAMTDSGAVFTSTDALEWSALPSLPVAKIVDLIFARGKFHVLDLYGIVLTSVDGRAWERFSIGTTDYVSEITEGFGKFLVAGKNGVVLSSDSLKTWTSSLALLAKDSSLFSDFSALEFAFNGKRFLAAGAGTYGRDIATSVDGKYWQRGGCADNLANTIAYHDDMVVVVTILGPSCYSTDAGATWKQGINPPNDVYGVVWADTEFVAVGGSGLGSTTKDGIHWKESNVPWLMGKLMDVDYGDGAVVAVGDYGTLISRGSMAPTTAIIAGKRPTPLAGIGLERRGDRWILRCDRAGGLQVVDLRGRQILVHPRLEAGAEVEVPRTLRGLLLVRLAGPTGSTARVISLP